MKGVVFWTLAKVKVDGPPETFAVLREGKTVYAGRTLTGFDLTMLVERCVGRFDSKDRAIRAERGARLAWAEHTPEIRAASKALRQKVNARDRVIYRLAEDA